MFLEIISFVLLIVAEVINFLFYFLLVTIGISIVVCICTKPDPTKFKEYVKFHFKHVNSNITTTNTLLKLYQYKVLQNIVDRANYQIWDLLVCRYAVIRLEGQNRVFIGAFNDWYDAGPET